MELLYEGVKISRQIDIESARFVDNAGDELDSLVVTINDPKNLWSQWKPQKNDTLEVKNGGYSTGTMYIDEISQTGGGIVLAALPIKQEAKVANIKGWDNVKLLEFVTEIAAKHDLSLEKYGIENHPYLRVDQYEQSGFDFLAQRCLLESYGLKVTNGKLVLFSQKYMEEQVPVKTIYQTDLNGPWSYKDKSTGIYSSCLVSYGDVSYEYNAEGTYGPTLKVFDLPVTNLGEAQRWAKGLLRANNKYEKVFTGTMQLDSGLAAGNVITLADFGLADGNYFLQQVVYDFAREMMSFKAYKPLEGY